jgi:hypothetical protein
MIKASHGDTVLDGKNVSSITAQHSKPIHYTSKLSNSETKVTETNRSSNCSRKIPAKDQMIFYGKIKC